MQQAPLPLTNNIRYVFDKNRAGYLSVTSCPALTAPGATTSHAFNKSRNLRRFLRQDLMFLPTLACMQSKSQQDVGTGTPRA
jgi:hypothetical protein